MLIPGRRSENEAVQAYLYADSFRVSSVWSKATDQQCLGGVLHGSLAQAGDGQVVSSSCSCENERSGSPYIGRVEIQRVPELCVV